MFEHLKPELPKILPLVVDWAERMQAEIQRSGRPLSPSDMEIASSMDVRHPVQIFISEVQTIPDPDNPYLADWRKDPGYLLL